MNVTICPTLEDLLEQKVLSTFDVHMARRLAQLGGEKDPRVLLALALASRAPAWGHVCFAIGRPVLSSAGEEHEGSKHVEWPEPNEWREALLASEIVGAGSKGETLPLVLCDGRVYLARYWRYQARLQDEIVRRTKADVGPVNVTRLGKGLARLFPGGKNQPSLDLQQVAAQQSVQRGFTVISGGPGTGKTTTVVKILALLQEQAQGQDRFPLRIALVAPTGKAAARLAESIKVQKAGLDVSEEIRAAVPEDASTIHRRLGFMPRTPTQFRYGADNKLPVDVLVCDESSMVDLPLMAKLFAAIPQGARVILLGDRHQLASVEAGSVLGDLCEPTALAGGYSAATVKAVKAVSGQVLPEASSPPPPLRDAIFELSHSYRFDSEGGIGGLAHAINGADAEGAKALLDAGQDGVGWIPAEARDRLDVLLGKRLREGFKSLVQASDPLEALSAFGAFGVLCAHRSGRRGVEAVNRLARQELAKAGLVPAKGEWYHGRPVMVRTNDYQVGLYNGDVGITLADPGDASRLRVHFLAPDGQSTREFSPAQLPDHQTVFGMTIHKSQGSEFAEVIVSLPERSSLILTRELVYTGITRAKKKVWVLGDATVLAEAIERQVHRASGLRGLLWGVE
ncbi:MAG: exodeoxyribonuclease V subunit alpha [Planctomycetes bacterium]|nr:exodeoxyribonuclease V subunit alpha [Planctomycetota bacterium]